MLNAKTLFKAPTISLILEVTSEAKKAAEAAKLTGVQKENKAKVGQTYEVLVTGPSKNNPEVYSSRTPHNQLMHFSSGRDGLEGKYVKVKTTKSTDLALYGELV